MVVDSKVTPDPIFESFLSHFWVTLDHSGVGPRESFLSHFNSFCISVELRGRPLHNARVCKNSLKNCHWGSEKNKEGWKTRERRKHNIKTLPKNGFGQPPPVWYVPRPPVCSCPVIFLRRNRNRPDQSHFASSPKLVLEGAHYSTFPPPPKSHDTFCPPICLSQADKVIT